MKFENSSVYNFEGAFRGMRNPLNSWNKSDSEFGIDNFDNMDDYAVSYNWLDKLYPDLEPGSNEYLDKSDDIAKWLRDSGIIRQYNNYETLEYAFIGPNDMNLAQRLCKAGSEHRKFLRQIQVCVDITAPLYW